MKARNEANERKRDCTVEYKRNVSLLKRSNFQKCSMQTEQVRIYIHPRSPGFDPRRIAGSDCLSAAAPVRIRLELKWIINDVLANQFCSAIINYRQGVRFKPYTLRGFPIMITYGRKLRGPVVVVDKDGPTRWSYVNLVLILANSSGRCTHY